MLKLPRRSSALSALAVLAASGVALSAGPVGASPQRAPHADAAKTTLSSGLNAVSVAPHSTLVWALGVKQTAKGAAYFALHGSHGHWKKIALPANGSYYSGIAAGAAKSAWVIGSKTTGPVILHSKGKTFKPVKLSPTVTSLTAISASSKKNIWAIGAGSSGPVVLHSKGKAFKDVKLPGPLTDGNLISVSTSSATNTWLLANISGGQAAVHWNGHSLKVTTLPALENSGTLEQIATSGPKNIWAVGVVSVMVGKYQAEEPVSEHSKGKSWNAVTLKSPGQYATPAGLAMVGSHVYMVGSSTPVKRGTDFHPFVEKVKGGHWHVLHVAKRGVTSQFLGVSASSKTVVAVGASYNGYECTGSAKPVYSSTYVSVLHGSKFATEAAPSYLPAGNAPDARAC